MKITFLSIYCGILILFCVTFLLGNYTRQSNYMQTGKVEYKPVNIEDLTIVRTQCIPLIKSTQILSGDIC